MRPHSTHSTPQDGVTPPDGLKPAGEALHGERTEVSWNDGEGRQPYANQGTKENGEPADAEFAVGDRGQLSGNNDQLEEVKKKP